MSLPSGEPSGQEAEKNMGAVTAHGSVSGGSSGTRLSSGLLIHLFSLKICSRRSHPMVLG